MATIDVQSRVVRARRGCVRSYEQVIAHYRPILQRRALLVASRNPGVDAANIESALVWSLHKAIEEFDPLRGPFEHYVNTAFAQAVLRTLRDDANDSFRRNVVASLSPVDADENGEKDDRLADSFDLEAHVLAELAVEEFVARVAGVDNTLGRIVALLAVGWTYEEIAKACGRSGSASALKMWTVRQIERIRQVVGREAS